MLLERFIRCWDAQHLVAVCGEQGVSATTREDDSNTSCVEAQSAGAFCHTRVAVVTAIPATSGNTAKYG